MPESTLRVLLVDDEAPARRRLRDLLDDCGTALPITVVGEAQHGREALDLLQSAPADLVLTDIHMPDMDGIEPSSQPGVISINVFLTRGEVHAILKNPYRAEGGRHHSGNKMALANVRERLALHFDAEASLESRVTKDGYEVHIRIPYRTAGPDAVDEPHRAPAQATAQPPARRKSSGASRRVHAVPVTGLPVPHA